MPTLGEVILPVLAGLASAASPYAARGIGAGLDVHQTLKRRRQQQAEQAEEARRRERLAQVIMGGPPGDPYAEAARNLAGAGAIEPALGLFTEGLRARQRQDEEERNRGLRQAITREPKRETRTETDPATGQKFRQLYVDGVPEGAPVPVYGRAAPGEPKPVRQWQSAGSYRDAEGYEVQKLLDPVSGEVRERRLGKAHSTERGAQGMRIRAIDEPQVRGGVPLATVEMPDGQVQIVPLDLANEMMTQAAESGLTPVMTRTARGATAVASPRQQGSTPETGAPAPSRATTVDMSGVQGLPVASAPRRAFRNKQTGAVEVFELRNGQWVRPR